MLQVIQAAPRACPEAGSRVCPPRTHSEGMELEKIMWEVFPWRTLLPCSVFGAGKLSESERG